MGTLINTKGGRYQKAEAERMAAQLQGDDPEWTYQVAPSPDAHCGLFCIEVREMDGTFVGLFGQ